MIALWLTVSALLAAAPSSTAVPKTSPGAFLVLADRIASDGDLDRAETVLRDGLAQNPDADGFHYGLGEIERRRGHDAEAFYELHWELLRAGDRPSAQAAAKEIGSLLHDAKSADAAEMRSVMTAMMTARSDPKSALATLSAVRAKRGDRFVLIVYQAEAARDAGDPAAAEKGLREAIARDATFAPACVELADLLQSEGRSAEADALRANAKAIDPTSWANR